MKKVTLNNIKSYKKNNRGISSITSYDASFAKLLDELGVDIVLVGDSLGEVVHGSRNTHSVTMTDMIYHTRCVARGLKRAYLISDMPKNSYKSKRQALHNAKKLLGKNLANMVKLETTIDDVDIIKHLVEKNIPVCGHIGVRPQLLKSKKEYKKIGNNSNERDNLINEAKAIELAGVKLMIVECVDSIVAKIITESLKIPVIGIGSGKHCDGQIRVVYDILGLSFNGLPGFIEKNSKPSLKDIFMKYIKSVKKK